MPTLVDGTPPYRPDVVLWLELPDHQVLYSKLVAPDEPQAIFAQSYLETTRKPLVGPARRPKSIRVATEDLAMQVRTVAGDVPVVVAPTPELPELAEMMASSLSEDGGYSYLDGGRISEEDVKLVFLHTAMLHRMKPWEATHGHLVRMDIPLLGVEGASVSILGVTNPKRGFVILPSRHTVQAFAAAEVAYHKQGFPPLSKLDVGAECLAIEYRRGADIPDSMLEEVRQHGWEVADATAYPIISRIENGAPLFAGADDMHLAAVGISAFAAFFIQYRELFDSERPEPVSVSYTNNDDLTVRFTLPYEAYAQFDRAGPPSRRVGRNERCPCGSGKKYKHCHFDADESTRMILARASSLHDKDRELVERILQHASRRFPDVHNILRIDPDAPGFEGLLMNWAAYHCEAEGLTLAEWFHRENKARLTRAEHEWLDAEQRAWLSVWEVTDVRPGEGLDLRDLLTGETRSVVERSASETLVLRNAILARVVDSDRLSLLCGVHPQPLDPVGANDVVHDIRIRLRRKRLIPVDRLRSEKLQRFMLICWDDAVEDMTMRLSVPRVVRNTDGHELVFTVDSFQFEASKRDALIDTLSTIDGVEPQDLDDDDESGFVFLRPGNWSQRSSDNTVVGSARVSDREFRIEANSIERADELRQRVETRCRDLLRHVDRKTTDLDTAMQDRKKRPAPPSARIEPTDPAALEALMQHKRQHYEAWLDDSLPALGGRTPRQAAATPRGRDQLERLLKEMESHEARLPLAERYDFDRIREALTIDR